MDRQRAITHHEASCTTLGLVCDNEEEGKGEYLSNPFSPSRGGSIYAVKPQVTCDTKVVIANRSLTQKPVSVKVVLASPVKTWTSFRANNGKGDDNSGNVDDPSSSRSGNRSGSGGINSSGSGHENINGNDKNEAQSKGKNNFKKKKGSSGKIVGFGSTLKPGAATATSTATATLRSSSFSFTATATAGSGNISRSGSGNDGNGVLTASLTTPSLPALPAETNSANNNSDNENGSAPSTSRSSTSSSRRNSCNNKQPRFTVDRSKWMFGNKGVNSNPNNGEDINDDDTSTAGSDSFSFDNGAEMMLLEDAGSGAPPTPRTRYIDGCLREKINPKASLFIRKTLSKTLDFHNLGMGDVNMCILAESLKDMPFVESMNVADNNLTDEGLSPLLAAVSNIATLTELNLSQNVSVV